MTHIAASLPRDLPASVCVAVHLPASRRSHLADILSRAGGPPAIDPVDGQPLERGFIYVAPPDHHLMIDDSHMRLWRGPKENLQRPAVNALFRSAAVSHGSRAIGVVLSGSLEDGATGLWWIKRYGGVAVVQDPADAKFPSMPQQALSTVDVDFSLPVARMPALLIHLVTGREGDMAAAARAVSGEDR